MLPKQKVAWYLLVQWQPPLTIRVMNHTPRPLREVQTLVATVERLTKKNHDLEEQLHQKNAGFNTQEEDQEGTSAEWRD